MFTSARRHLHLILATVVTLGFSAGAFSAHAAPKKTPKKAVNVAVLYFDYDGKTADMGHLRKGLAQMLISDLSGVGGVNIVERSRLEEVLKELKLSRTAKFDRRTANRVGKLLGARYLVMGGFFDFGKTLRIDARIVDVETGKIVGTFGDNSYVEEFLKLEQALADSLGKSLASLPSTRAANKNRKWRKTRKRSKKSLAASGKRKAEAPIKVSFDTIKKYSAGLHAKDQGDNKKAKHLFQMVVKRSPGFELAVADLASLAQ